MASCPNANIYIQSVLPIAKEKEATVCKNETIVQFNQALQSIAEEYGVVYIDVHSLYAVDGVMRAEDTKDGVHLRPEAYEVWERAIAAYIS